MFLANGAHQQEMRKFALASFRDFGVGKVSIDEMMQAEGDSFCDYLEEVARSSSGIVSDLKRKTQLISANVIHSIIFGSR